jgi:hypothetical protein
MHGESNIKKYACIVCLGNKQIINDGEVAKPKALFNVSAPRIAAATASALSLCTQNVN